MSVQGSTNRRGGEQEPLMRACKWMARVKRMVWRASCVRGKGVVRG